MTGFVLLAAAMLALALAFVVLPLLRTRAAGTGAKPLEVMPLATWRIEMSERTWASNICGVRPWLPTNWR